MKDKELTSEQRAIRKAYEFMVDKDTGAMKMDLFTASAGFAVIAEALTATAEPEDDRGNDWSMAKYYKEDTERLYQAFGSDFTLRKIEEFCDVNDTDYREPIHKVVDWLQEDK